MQTIYPCRFLCFYTINLEKSDIMLTVEMTIVYISHSNLVNRICKYISILLARNAYENIDGVGIYEAIVTS